MTSYTHTLPYEELPKLKNDIADLLRKKGLDAIVIDEALAIDTLPKNRAAGPKATQRDFSSLKAKYHVDKLLVINVTTLGFVRSYSAYIPTSDPIGTFRGTGYIVNLDNNSYEWYLPVAISKSAEGEWKEPPNYPGLTNAYFQALETGRDEFLKPFVLR